MEPSNLHLNLGPFLPTSQSSGNVAFESFRNRDLYPFLLRSDMFLIKHLQPMGFPAVGPGKYENEEKTNLVTVLKSKQYNRLSCSAFGSRKVTKVPSALKMSTPCPTEYQQNPTEPICLKPAAKPFGFGSKRLLYHTKSSYLSPTTYNINTIRDRKVSHHQSFGKAPIYLPEITIKSTIPQNTNKLYTTNEEQKYLQKLAYLRLYW